MIKFTNFIFDFLPVFWQFIFQNNWTQRWAPGFFSSGKNRVFSNRTIRTDPHGEFADHPEKTGSGKKRSVSSGSAREIRGSSGENRIRKKPERFIRIRTEFLKKTGSARIRTEVYKKTGSARKIRGWTGKTGSGKSGSGSSGSSGSARNRKNGKFWNVKTE